MRLALPLLHNFPERLHYDFFTAPEGVNAVGLQPALTYLIATPGKLFNLTEHQIEVYAAFLPPVFAVLAVIAMYFLALEAFHNRTFALVAAFLMGILPTEFFHRTLLGFTDHHFLEVLLVILSLLFLLKLFHASDSARYWWTLLLGLSQSLLYLSWAGAGYVTLILTAATMAEIYRLRLKDRKVFSTAGSVAVAALITAAIFNTTLSYHPAKSESFLCLIVGWIGPMALASLADEIHHTKAFIIVSLLGGVALITGLCFLLPIPAYCSAVFGHGSADIISETSPLTLNVALGAFGLSLPLCIPGIFFWIRRRLDFTLLIFFIPILVSTIGQVRYGYYLAIPVTIFASYGLMQITRLIRPHLRVAVTVTALVIVVMASLVNILTMATFKSDTSPSMYQALTWLRNNTPEPYSDDPNAFYSVALTETANYQVLAWWDYGDQVAYIARRAPLSSPFGHFLPEMTEFFADGDIDKLETVAKQLYGEDNVDIRYILLEPADMKLKWYQHITGKNQMMTPRLLARNEFETVYQNDEVMILERKR